MYIDHVGRHLGHKSYRIFSFVQENKVQKKFKSMFGTFVVFIMYNSVTGMLHVRLYWQSGSCLMRPTIDDGTILLDLRCVSCNRSTGLAAPVSMPRKAPA